MRLFLYGTLMAGQPHALARRLHAALGPGERAWVAGAMVAIPDPGGWYPALVAGGRGRAWGKVHGADGVDAALWAALDAYEQVVTAGPGYVRRVVLGDAQAYVWQGALPQGAVALEDGDFAAFLARTGERSYQS